MPPVAVNRKVSSNTEIKNTSVDFNTNYPEENINTYNTSDESEWKGDFSTDINDYDSSGSVFCPWNIFAVLWYLKK